MLLRIDVEEDGNRRVVRLGGECDLSTAPQLQEALGPMRAPDVNEIIVDVSQLSFMDSTGLGVLVGALKRVRESEGQFKIAGAQGAVARVLEVSGLDRIIPQFPSVEAAKA
ncbi:MAG TPA: anti-sigma factor antagonist [Actinomycetota bacterium]|nr:anti-sigma factor antagonist [Actinomycetota bacterium]